MNENWILIIVFLLAPIGLCLQAYAGFGTAVLIKGKQNGRRIVTMRFIFRFHLSGTVFNLPIANTAENTNPPFSLEGGHRGKKVQPNKQVPDISDLPSVARRTTREPDPGIAPREGNNTHPRL
jgi:hypothetical protein